MCTTSLFLGLLLQYRLEGVLYLSVHLVIDGNENLPLTFPVNLWAWLRFSSVISGLIEKDEY